MNVDHLRSFNLVRIKIKTPTRIYNEILYKCIRTIKQLKAFIFKNEHRIVVILNVKAYILFLSFFI